MSGALPAQAMQFITFEYLYGRLNPLFDRFFRADCTAKEIAVSATAGAAAEAGAGTLCVAIAAP